jgi:hypothetical protein
VRRDCLRIHWYTPSLFLKANTKMLINRQVNQQQQHSAIAQVNTSSSSTPKTNTIASPCHSYTRITPNHYPNRLSKMERRSLHRKCRRPPHCFQSNQGKTERICYQRRQRKTEQPFLLFKLRFLALYRTRNHARSNLREKWRFRWWSEQPRHRCRVLHKG